MFIRLLREENIGNLRSIEIVPGPDGVTLTGKNGAGKTSTLNGMIYTLNGGKTIPDDVLREGEKKGFVEIHLGGDPDGPVLHIVSREFNRSHPKGKLKITGDKGGMTDQQFLDSIVGAITFNPMRFMDAPPKYQRDMLLDGLGLTERLKVIEAEEKQLYNQRTEAGRDRDAAKARSDALPRMEVPDKVDIGAKSAELEAAKTKHAAWVKLTGEISEAEQYQERLSDEIADLERKLENTRAELVQCRQTLASWKKELTEKPVVPDSLEQQIREAYGINQRHDAAIEQNRKHDEAGADYQKRQNYYNELTTQIEALRQSKTDLLDGVQWPIENLSFDEAGLLLNERAFELASLGERITASCLIGMSMNPGLKVMFIDANALDSDNLALVRKLALEKGYQLWIEAITAPAPGDERMPVIEIVDGSIKDDSTEE